MKYSDIQYKSKMLPESIAECISVFDLKFMEYSFLLNEMWREDRHLLLPYENEELFIHTIQNHISLRNIENPEKELKDIKADIHTENDIFVIDDNILGLSLNLYLTEIYLSHRYRFIKSIWNKRSVNYPMVAVDLFLENFGFNSYVGKIELYELDDIISLRKEQTNRYKEFYMEGFNYIELVYSEYQIWENIETLELYLNPYGYMDKRNFALDLIKNGVCFIAYKEGDEIKFAPSRFVGYVNNDMLKHENNEYKDGRETTKAISDILGAKPIEDVELEEEYQKFCENNSVIVGKKGAFGVKRKYWRMF